MAMELNEAIIEYISRRVKNESVTSVLAFHAFKIDIFQLRTGSCSSQTWMKLIAGAEHVC
jgi:hypothetical protein